MIALLTFSFVVLLAVPTNAQMHLFYSALTNGNLGGSRANANALCTAKIVSAGYTFCGTTWALVGFNGESFTGNGFVPPSTAFNSSLAVYGPTEVLIANTWSNLFNTSLVGSALVNTFATAGLPNYGWFNLDSVARTYLTSTNNDWCSGWTSTSTLILGTFGGTVNTQAMDFNSQNGCNDASTFGVYCACLPPGTASPTVSPTTSSPTPRTRAPTTVSCNRASRRLRQLRQLRNHHQLHFQNNDG